MEERGWTQAELAQRTGFSAKHVSELISGKTAITPQAAIRLETVLGSTARFWLAREAQYQEALVRANEVARLRSEIRWLKELPLRHLREQKWIQTCSDAVEQVRSCLQFFGVASVDAWRDRYERPLAAFRASQSQTFKAGAVAAWLRRGEEEASKISCSPYSETGFRCALQGARDLTVQVSPDVFLPQLRSLCASVGVALAVVPAPPGCPAYGATRWLGPDRALLMVSLRYKTNDHLWFTFFHESAHLLLHGKKLLFLEGAMDAQSEMEEEANVFAKEVLIPRREASALSALAARPSHAAVVAFAKRVGIAPGIVVGRLQNEGLLPWTHLNGLKVKYRWSDNRT